MKTYYFLIVLFLSGGLFFTSCDSDDDDFNLDNFKEVSLQGEDTSCITEGQEELGKVSKLSGEIVFHKVKDSDTEIVLIKDNKGLTYIPCGLPKEYEEKGLKIIFSGTKYGPDPAAFYAYTPTGGFLKLTNLWVHK